MIFEGALSVKSALLNDKRDIDIIYIDKDKKDRDTRFIQKVAADKKVKVKLVSRSYIDEVASGKSHGGIILKASERRYDALKREPFIFVVDGIEDPFNLGYIFRTLKAFGHTSIIIPKRDLSTMEQTIMKSSAGAFDMVDIYQSDDLRKDLSELKKEYEILALSRSDKAKDIFDYRFKEKTVIILGGEKRGIKKDILALGDELFISYKSDFRPALNASSALAVVCAVMRTNI